MEGNASVYQRYPGGRITGEGMAEISRAWGPGFKQEGAGGGSGGGGGRGGGGQVNLCAETIYPLKGTNMMAVEGMHRSITYIL